MSMRRFAAWLVCLAMLVSSSAALAQKAYVREDLRDSAIQLEAQLRRSIPNAAQRPAAQWRTEATNAMRAGSWSSALNGARAAVAADPRDAANWLILARTLLNYANSTDNWSQRYTSRNDAASAAYAAYDRARSGPDEGAALAELGRSYEARSMWRPALDAYRLSLAANDNLALRRSYEALRAERGFRVVDYKIDSDAASPRICFNFSDPLARGRVDFAPYVVVQGLNNPAVSADNTQLCIDGLKHGERYRFVLRQGLPSAVEETLLTAADYDIYVRDRSPQVRFTGRNYVLPRTGQDGIPLVSVNTSRVELDVYRIGDRSLVPTVRSDEFLQQLGGYSAREIARQRGVKVWSGSIETANTLNQDVVTTFPVTEAVQTLQPGIHILTATLRRPPETGNGEGYDDLPDEVSTQWFVVSDLGITSFTAPDGLHVLTRSLATARPVGNVELRLIARNNDVLATLRSDRYGYARFDAGLARGTDGQAPALVVAADGNGDYGFLDVAGAAFDLSDRGVKGRVAPRGLDAMLVPERGVYRPGETVHVTALVRDIAGQAAPALPITLVYKRPDGVEHRRVVVQDGGAGGRAHSLSLFSGAARGMWRVQAFTDPRGPAIGEATFLVEDYVPDRIDVTLTPGDEVIRPGAAPSLEVSARYLYGAPGGGLSVSGDVTVQPAARSPIRGLEDWLIGLQDETVEPVTQEIEEAAETDADGKASFSVTLPEVTAQRPLEAKIRARVGESGGRGVERTVTLPIALAEPVVAVRKRFQDAGLSAGAIAGFDLVAAAPDGTRLARSVTWQLMRVERTYQWYMADGRWSFEPSRTTRRVADGRIDIAAGEPARLEVPVDWGSYRLDVTMGGTQTSVPFSVGYWGEPTADAPDLLEVALDKQAYAAGEEMKLSLKPRFAGRATIAIVGGGVQDVREIELPAEGTTVELEAKPEYGAGAYVVVLAHRPLDQAARRMPGRAVGLAWFSVDRAAKTLDVSLGTPERIRPRGTLDIPVRLTGLNPGEEAFVTVSAVDVGILNLTRHEVPNPAEHFFGQRQLSAELRDLYGFLIDGMQGTRGAIRSGGDAGVDTSVSPPREAPLARYSGIVKVGDDGTANVSFDIPAFDGAVRVVALAWTAGRVGAASKEVLIRDALVAQATLPRFLTLGDRSRFHVRIDNVEGPAGDYTVEVEPAGPIAMPADALVRQVRLDARAGTELTIPVTAAGVGNGLVTVRLSGPDGAAAERALPIQITPGSDAILRRVARRLAPGESLTVSADLANDVLPGSGSISTSVSALGGIDVPALLAALERYPYGCTEQLVSRAMPLLYLSALGGAERLGTDAEVEARIRDAIDRILARQDSSGAFGAWSVGGDDLFLDAYALDFLTRARERNFEVPRAAFESGLDRLRNQIVNQPEWKREGGEAMAYALYVLARNGRPMMSDLRYVLDTKLGEVPTPFAKAHIAAALALLGDRARAERGFREALASLSANPITRRTDYGSRLRDAAGLLALGAESQMPADTLIQTAALVGETRAAARLTSTQENAWLVLAAQATVPAAREIALSVDGQPHTGPLHRSDRAAALEAKPLVIANTGAQPVDAVLTVSGNPAEPQPAVTDGAYGIERAYYRLNGQKVDPSSIRQNERLVVVLTVTEREQRQGRLLVVDHLPAGLEIDNPNLVDGGKVEGLPWLTRVFEPVHSEFRDDRFVAAIDRFDDRRATFSLAYMVRAISPGRYVHPPAVVEDMYVPTAFGRTAYGTVEVTGR